MFSGSAIFSEVKSCPPQPLGWLDLPAVLEDVQSTPCLLAGIQDFNCLAGTFHSGPEHGFVSPEIVQDDSNFSGGKVCIETVLFDAVQTEEEVQVAPCLLGMMKHGFVEYLLAYEKAAKKEVIK